MAYRRRHGMTRASTFKEEIYHKPEDDIGKNNHLQSSHSFTSSSSLAVQAIRASTAHRDSPLSSPNTADSGPEPRRSKVFDAYQDPLGKNDSKGFWGVLARKAKAILEDDTMSQETPTFIISDTASISQSPQPNVTADGAKKIDNPTIRKGLDRITTSLNNLGDTFERAYEEGRSIVESRTADIKQQIRKKGSTPEAQNATTSIQTQQPHNTMNHENQLKASRDVAMATAAKAKLLLRELKTIKADLAFAKQRCSQLEEENKLLRESREKGVNPADDDLIRLQLETLLAEKARVAHENSVYARENRFLREIVEYHQLTMQDIVYLDEGSEEVTEVHPFTKMLSISPPSPMSPPSEILSSSASPTGSKETISVRDTTQQIEEEVPETDDVPPSLPEGEDLKAVVDEEDEVDKATAVTKEESAPAKS